ncbi:cell surface A33 antigen isoform X2 [Oreochromis niloticus]|uniref:cell surface A33 antigen isoform X2 n=1 Tax=Oreochromis niloticus TaxID=8128 RepID=UPI00025F86D1|nr:cell surface A33 antigen isoform X2 [Oreochromis niloticus]XP_039462764.1 cell surface A33 antigen-like isoform X2 [Oreochromis aureus]
MREKRCLHHVMLMDQENITAESGQNVTLTCRAPNIKNDLVEWSRADLGDEYVLFYRDDLSVSDHQHQSFKNRVDLQDRQMKDGDVSLVLMNVTINDTGTYKCRVPLDKTHSSNPISIIFLSVVDPPAPPGGATEDGDGVGRRHHGRLIASVLCLVVIIVVFFKIFHHYCDPL